MKPIIECELCPRHCRLAEGERGDCRVRVCLDGELKTLAYGNPCAVHIDPIEKKPFYHVLPESGSFSIATAGCNLHCKYCQNWQISQRPPEETENYELKPRDVVREALKNNCRSIAYTYSDPVIFYEYTYETSQLARARGLLNILVTAGYIEQKPLKKLCAYTDAANVDLKAITDEFYKSMSDAHLKPVQDCILTMKRLGVWVEITNLVVPTWNDSEKDLRALTRWIREFCGADTPLHFSRFSPMHQLKNLPPTPVSTLNMAWETARSEGLNFVYVGNIPGHPGNNTYCPVCKNILIKRMGCAVIEKHLAEGQCQFCNTRIPGIWKL